MPGQALLARDLFLFFSSDVRLLQLRPKACSHAEQPGALPCIASRNASLSYRRWRGSRACRQT